MKAGILIVSAELAALAAATILPGARQTESPAIFLAVVLLTGGAVFWRILRGIKPRAAADIGILVLGVLLLWEFMSKHLALTNPVLIPPPEDVFYVFYTHGGMMLAGVLSSMELLIAGFGVSLVFGVGLGLLIGWTPRLGELFYPIVKVLAPIPSVIYTPYIIAVMPSFRSASAMIIILGLFFPLLLQMIVRVHTIDKRMLDSARTLGLRGRTMILKVLLPYMLPGIISGIRVSLSAAFMILTLAEMMGATSGIGYFIKSYADFANYTNVIAGIILEGLVVTFLNALVTKLEKKVVKWA